MHVDIYIKVHSKNYATNKKVKTLYNLERTKYYIIIYIDRRFAGRYQGWKAKAVKWTLLISNHKLVGQLDYTWLPFGAGIEADISDGVVPFQIVHNWLSYNCPYDSIEGAKSFEIHYKTQLMCCQCQAPFVSISRNIYSVSQIGLLAITLSVPNCRSFFTFFWIHRCFYASKQHLKNQNGLQFENLEQSEYNKRYRVHIILWVVAEFYGIMTWCG
jgi:hypothetical protein